jgi:endonuclease/exonuclease/phosphatase family metal-dependent hydrolase
LDETWSGRVAKRRRWQADDGNWLSENIMMDPGGKHKKRLLFEVLESRQMFNGTADLRIVAYNIAADIYSEGITAAPQPAIETVLEGIGNESVNGNARPIDILALEETTSNALTVAPIVTALNNHYGAGTYVASTYQATTSGGGDGDGPNALVYNSSTVTLVSTEGVGNPSDAGYPRQPVRYEFRPVGGSAADDFFVYVSHYKSGNVGTDDNGARRQAEAVAIRADEATLPATARVLYVGDYNLNSASDPGYETITAAGQGQAIDPINSPFFSGNQAPRATKTESATALNSRLDLELVTQNVMSDPNGLYYVTGSYHAFGNDGSVSNVVNSTTALSGLPNRTAVLSALTVTSDHLPIVADYTDTVTPPVGPAIGTFSINPTSVSAGATVTLTAANVIENGSGSVCAVKFYRESNGTSGLQVGSDVLVGSAVQNGANWTLTVSTSGLGGGVYTYYAQATDTASLTSDVASTTLSVSGTSTPTIGSMTISPTSVVPGATITLGALNVVKSGGTINRVAFYQESNGTPGLQIGSDTLLGTGTQGGSSWYYSTNTTILAAGTQFFYAVATDTFGVSSATASVSLNVIPPQVANVMVDGTGWTPDYLSELQANGLGSGGYSIPVHSINQLQTLGWVNIDQIQIVFSQDVSVQQASLALTGVSGGTYSFASFDYNEDTFTATWTLTAPIGADKLHIDLQSGGPAAVENLAGSPLDGEWTDSVSRYPSGNGTAGGDFNFSFNVLPGDANQDGVVNGLDIQQLASSWLQSTFAGDVNGDDVVNGLDLNTVASHWLISLPTGGGSASSNVDSDRAFLMTAAPGITLAPVNGGADHTTSFSEIPIPYPGQLRLTA